MPPIPPEVIRGEHERFGSARDGVCVLSPDWKIRYANASLLEILRLLGGGGGVATLWDALPGWERAPEADALRTAMERRERAHFRVDEARGRGRVWEVEAVPLVAGGLRVRLHNATQQVQRDRLAQAGAGQPNRLAAAVAQAPVGLALVEAGSWRLREANPAALALLAPPWRAAGAAVGRSLAEVIRGWAESGLEARLARVAATGAPWEERELEHRAPGLETRWFHVTVRRLEGEDAPGVLLAVVVEVTPEVRARRAADAERRTLFAVLDALPVGIAVAAAPDGRLSYLNPAAVEITGGAESPDEALALPGGAALPVGQSPLRRALRGVTVRDEALQVRRADGEEREVAASASPVSVREGGVERAVLVLHDLTDRGRMERELVARRAEAEAAAAEAVLRAEESRALREIARALVSEVDPGRVLHLAVHAAEELLAARGAFIASERDAHVHFSAATGPLAPLRGRAMRVPEGLLGRLPGTGALRANTPGELPPEPALRRRLRRLGVRRLVLAPMHAFGELLGVIGVVDRHDPFTAEDVRVLQSLADSSALALHNARLLAAERRRAEEGEALLIAAEAASSTLDATEVMRRIVAIAQRLAGGDGAGIALLRGTTGRLRMEVAAGLMGPALGSEYPVAGSLTERVLAGGRARVVTPADLVGGEIGWRAPAALDHAHYTLAPLRVSGEPFGVLWVVHARGRPTPPAEELRLLQSLADQAALAIRNARLYEQAQGASRAKSDFLATMSHELRTPINALEGYASLLEDGVFGPVNEAQAHALGRMRVSQRHLLTLIEQVLDAARLEAGARRTAPAATDGREVAAGVVEALRGTAGRKGLVLELDAPEPAPLRTDPGLLRQILTNVVGNALKFTDHGTVRVRVARGADEGLRVVVEDTGPGIAPEHLDLIWEPFYQVEPAMTRREGGTGLGLALSREYARLLGGELQVTSRPGEGSAFILTLPPRPA